MLWIDSALVKSHRPRLPHPQQSTPVCWGVRVGESDKVDVFCDYGCAIWWEKQLDINQDSFAYIYYMRDNMAQQPELSGYVGQISTVICQE